MSRWTKVRLLCFDWNGTLLDDASFIFEGVKAIFRHFDKPEPSFAQYRNEIGVAAKGFYASRGIDAPWETLDEIMNTHLVTLSPPDLMPGARTTLETFRRRGMPMALVSLREPCSLAHDLERFGLTDFFGVICGGVHDKKTALLHLQDAFECGGGNLVFVSDTYRDIVATREAGCVPIAFAGGYGSIASLRSAKPELLIDDLIILTRCITRAKY